MCPFQPALTVVWPRRVAASSNVSSWTSDAVWTTSIAAANSIRRASAAGLKSRPTNRARAGRMYLPREPNRCRIVHQDRVVAFAHALQDLTHAHQIGLDEIKGCD